MSMKDSLDCITLPMILLEMNRRYRVPYPILFKILLRVLNTYSVQLQRNMERKIGKEEEQFCKFEEGNESEIWTSSYKKFKKY